MSLTFDIAFERLIGHEGGFTDDPRDPGNWTGGRVNVGVLKGTKYGIAANTYGHLDIERLSLHQAKAIYYTDWWLKAGADVFHPALVYQMWVFAVNAGMTVAKQKLQQVVGAVPDGRIGPLTIALVNAKDVNDIVYRYLALEIRHYVSLKKFDVFGRGWMNRVAGSLDYMSEDN